jgi:tetratricopeptide (TPR) repeat protein
MRTHRTVSVVLIAALLACSAAEIHASSALEEATVAIDAGNFAKASELLEPLTGANGKDAAAYSALSRVRLEQKKAVEAIALAERATALDPTRAEYFAQLGMSLGQRISEVSFIQQAMMSGKLRRAFARAVELDPNCVAGLIGLTRFHANAPEIAGGSTKKAREYALRVKQLAPFTGEMELANIAEREENLGEAAEHFAAATQINPAHAWAQFRCGETLAKLGRKDEARSRFEAVLKIDGNFEAAKKALANLDASPAAG